MKYSLFITVVGVVQLLNWLEARTEFTAFAFGIVFAICIASWTNYLSRG